MEDRMMTRKVLVLLFAVSLALTACCALPRISASVIQGSGRFASETRHRRGFRGVVLKMSADVDITVRDQDGSVVVTAEDNIIPLIETQVRLGQLVISTRSGADISASGPIRIEVTTKALNRIQLSGSGNVTARDVDKAEITIEGSGQVLCDGLKAKTATVRLPGSGNVTVYASDSLDATISGSGNIRYSGNPAAVHKSVAGSGNIEP
jgi:hypothetical protein